MLSPLTLTDGGIETDLMFHHGQDLPHFAAFVLLDTEKGRETLRAYYRPYLQIARDYGLSLVLETPTWRASADWIALLRRPDSDVQRINQQAVQLLTELRDGNPDVPLVVSGCIGPRTDGYDASATMDQHQAQRYHSSQIEALHDAGADQVTAMTVAYPAEAIGMVRAAHAAGVPAVISFTVEVDGQLPDGSALDRAIGVVDQTTDPGPLSYMVNCAHPSHVEAAFGLPPETDTGEQPTHHPASGTASDHRGWTARVTGVRANASPRSHAELDTATDLDEGNPAQFGAALARLRATVTSLAVLGGCCGTDQRHIREVARATSRAASPRR
ncbi:MAG: homocysteine S-methyltransferase family protein [Terracoccus sp.]